MSHNGKDTSGNSFKFSLIPLFLGIVLIFFLYRSCKNSVYEPKPNATTEAVATEGANSEQPVVETETVDTTAQTDKTVETDTVQAAQ